MSSDGGPGPGGDGGPIEAHDPAPQPAPGEGEGFGFGTNFGVDLAVDYGLLPDQFAADYATQVAEEEAQTTLASLLMPGPAGAVIALGNFLTDVPPDHFAPAVGAGSSDPDPGGVGEAIGGPSEEELRDEYPIGAPGEPAVTPLPEVVDASSDAVPEMADTSAATSASAAEASDITPSPATSAPGTLIRRRRRTRTILTSPQGVGGLGGEGSALRGKRRTRSLPRKTLLGG